MTWSAAIQGMLFLGALLALAPPLGAYMARVYEGRPTGLDRVLGPPERAIYRICGIRRDEEMPWTTYAVAVLLFGACGALCVYALQRTQAFLPLNPQSLPNVAPDSSFDTAISFATNTNWQGYGGETTMSYLTQMLGLGVQNFVSAATGMAILVALIRGFARKNATTIGSFWVDLVRSTLYILLPFSFVLAVALISQGVVQSLAPYATARTLEPRSMEIAVSAQSLPLGPAASQIAIKQLGTNGGGFFNANSAHPFENPTALSGFLESLAILAIAAGLCHTFGRMVGDARQGWALIAAMTILFVVPLAVCTAAEQQAPAAYASLGVDARADPEQPGGNMEGKEARFGVAASALWATSTTAASNGSVNASHDSFTPLGGLVPMFLMQLGEVAFGGVGSGLYGMLMFVIVAVFVAGLMVGRTPEYLGKKIEPFEMKMAAIAVLVPLALTLIGTAAGVSTPAGRAGIANPGAHGFSEVLYAFSSASNNNGSAFAGLGANTPFYNVALALCMFFGRFWIALPVLAIAGSMAAKKTIPASGGTLPTHTPIFVALLLATVVIVGALTFVPALALGPVAEQLQAGVHNSAGATGK